MRLEPKQTRLAVPSKGRLMEPAEELLKAAGVKYRRKERALYAHADGLEMAVLFVRPDDIPVLVSEGAADMGVVGWDLVHEAACERRVKRLLDLDFGHCRLAVAVPEKSAFRRAKDLRGKRIAASMIRSAQEFFRREKTNVHCVQVSGSVEIMIALGLADAIVDLVQSGDTLRENGLRVMQHISSTQAVLIANPKPRDAKLCAILRRRLEGVLTARQYTLLEYNIRRDHLKFAEKIAPGFDSPTVSDLEDPKWCAVKVLVPRKQVVETMDKLEAVGASAILETPVNHCRL
jgi:ATP phosphoribosyltransferase